MIPTSMRGRGERGYCSGCGGFFTLRKDGTVRQHGHGRGDHYRGCAGGGQAPIPSIGIARLGPRGH